MLASGARDNIIYIWNIKIEKRIEEFEKENTYTKLLKKFKGKSKEVLNEELLIAAEEGDFKKVLALLEAGADVNAEDDYGRTPLYYAVFEDHLEVVELLLEYGAKVNIKDWEGKPLLHYAASKGDLELVRILLEYGAKVNFRDKNGWTPLHYAVSGVFRKFFLENGEIK